MLLNLCLELFTPPATEPSLPSGVFAWGKLTLLLPLDTVTPLGVAQWPCYITLNRGPAYLEPFAHRCFTLSLGYSRYNPFS